MISKEENKTRKPVIGIVPLFDSEKDSLWMVPGYMDMICEMDGVPFMLPLNTDESILGPLYEMCDGILFTGGQDVTPALYGEERLSVCGETCGLRDTMETYFFKKCFQDDKPAFGICRGIQFINVMMGGTLYQDLSSEYKKCNIDHHMKPPYDRVCHEVCISAGTPLHRLLQTERIGVNSYHHQAVRRLGDGLLPMAYSQDGLVEAVQVKGKSFIWAVQWHPEFNFKTDESSRKIVKAFVEACTN